MVHEYLSQVIGNPGLIRDEEAQGKLVVWHIDRMEKSAIRVTLSHGISINLAVRVDNRIYVRGLYLKRELLV